MIELKQKPKRKTEQWGYVDDNTIEIVHINSNYGYRMYGTKRNQKILLFFR